MSSENDHNRIKPGLMILVVGMLLLGPSFASAQVADQRAASGVEDESTETEETAGGAGSDFAYDEEDDIDYSANVEEMFITSTKTKTNDEVPIASSSVSFSGMELVEAQITDIAGLADYTPNLEINTGASSVANPTIFIRGIGLLDFNSNAVSSVAVINDGVYQNSPLGQLFSFYDLQGVEVLRGPQGSLHARNATAGAILVQPKRPTGDLDAYVRTRVGNYGFNEFEGAMSVPILEDVLSARVSGKYAQRDGFTQNRCGIDPTPDAANSQNCYRTFSNRNLYGDVPVGLPTEVNDLENWGTRAILRYQPNDWQDWTLNVNGGQSSGLAYQFQSRGSGNFADSDGIGRDSLGYRDADHDPFAGDYDLVDNEDLDIISSTLRGEMLFDGFKLNWVTGYSRVALAAKRNFDASPNQFAHVYSNDLVWQISQEISLASDRGSDFEWDVGVFGLYEELSGMNTLLEGLIFTRQLQEIEQKVSTWAIYARGAYMITDSLRLTAGIRYNWEHKTFNLRISEELTPLYPDLVKRETRNQTQAATWVAPTGEVVLSWLPTDSIEVYGKYTRGFKNGHFNGGAFFSAQLIDPVEPESVSSFELGLRSTLLDGFVQLNAAAWYYDYENYQVFALENTQGSLPLSQLLNAPRVESKGIEMDLSVLPVDGMQVFLSVAILQAAFTEFTVNRAFIPSHCPELDAVGFCVQESETIDFSGNPLVASPPVSVSAGIVYDILLGSWGTLTPRLDVAYRGKTYYQPGDETSQNTGPEEGATQEAYFLLNLRLAFAPPDQRFELAFWVRNAANKIYLANSFDVRDGLGTYLDIFGAPRTFGATVTMNW